MSAITIIRQTNTVHVVSDALAYFADGRINNISSKAWPLAHLNLVVACRGPRLFGTVISEYVGSIGHTYDEVKSRIAVGVRYYFEGSRAYFEKCEMGSEFDLFVAGISETTGPDSYLLSNHGRHGERVKPWEIADCGPLSIAPCDDDILAAFHAGLPAGAIADQLDPVRDGIRILELQRARRHPHGPDHTAVHGIGGFAQLTTVSSEQITTRVIHRWADKVGAFACVAA